MASTINAKSTGSGSLESTADASGQLALQANGSTIATISSTGLAVTGTITSNGVTTSPYTMKNRIINGAMLIDQRNAGTVLTCSAGANTYTVDRWQVENSTSSATCTAQQVSGNANTSQGYSQSLKLTVGTTGSATAAQVINLVQKIEGLNVQDLAWGTANAKSITVSFWVYSSLIGTYCSTIRNSNGRSYTVEYSIPVANTWTQITYTVPGDTTTSLATDNTFSLGLYFDLGSGSNFNTTAGAWQTGNYRRTTNQVNWINTSAATFYLVGVQVEVGSSATSFEWRPFGMELALCQRYYEKGFGINAVPASANADYWNGGGLGVVAYQTNFLRTASVCYRVEKRATPTVTLYNPSGLGTSGNWAYYNGSWSALTTSSIETSGSSTNTFNVRSTATGTTGQTYIINGGWTADAEL